MSWSFLIRKAKLLPFEFKFLSMLQIFNLNLYSYSVLFHGPSSLVFLFYFVLLGCLPLCLSIYLISLPCWSFILDPYWSCIVETLWVCFMISSLTLDHANLKLFFHYWSVLVSFHVKLQYCSSIFCILLKNIYAESKVAGNTQDIKIIRKLVFVSIVSVLHS